MSNTVKRLARNVKRAGSDRYLLLMLISFALSVSLTRGFLDLTGYPQLGSSELHIAHVVWGGLILFIAAILPLIYANRWVYQVTAALSGLGVGLFIDEIGKFITQSNDYFYPPAAPIIYGFFLLTVVLYSSIKRTPTRDDRTELYHVLDLLEEVLDYDLDPEEKEDLEETLARVKSVTKNPDYTTLADELTHFIATQQPKTSRKSLYLTDQLNLFLEKTQQRVPVKFLHYFCVIALLLIGGFMTIYPLQVYLASTSPDKLNHILQPLIQQQLVSSSTEFSWYIIRLALEIATGCLFILSAGLLLTRRIKAGLNVSYFGMILAFTIVDLLIFYYDQFSTIFFVTIQLIVFIAINTYRRKEIIAASKRG